MIKQNQSCNKKNVAMTEVNTWWRVANTYDCFPHGDSSHYWYLLSMINLAFTRKTSGRWECKTKWFWMTLKMVCCVTSWAHGQELKYCSWTFVNFWVFYVYNESDATRCYFSSFLCFQTQPIPKNIFIAITDTNLLASLYAYSSNRPQTFGNVNGKVITFAWRWLHQSWMTR